MADLIRQMTVERGMDPRDFALYAYGGAAGLHVGGLPARARLGAGDHPARARSRPRGRPTAVRPRTSIHVHERNHPPASPFDAAELGRRARRARAGGRDELSSEGIPAERQTIERFVEMKYPLQIHRVEVADYRRRRSTRRPPGAIAVRFAERYDQLYGKGSAFEGAGSEIVGCRVVGRGRLPAARGALDRGGGGRAGARAHRHLERRRRPEELTTRVVPAARSAPSARPSSGPAIVAAATTTILDPAGRERVGGQGRQPRARGRGGACSRGRRGAGQRLGVRVGIYTDLRNPPQWRRAWPDHYERKLERIVEAERLGAGSVWVSEHHGFEDGYLPQPLTFAAAIAARTSRVRIGTAIMLGPLRPALDVAEQAAIVDIVSGGRLELGLGTGYRASEYRAFERDIEGRYPKLEAPGQGDQAALE